MPANGSTGRVVFHQLPRKNGNFHFALPRSPFKMVPLASVISDSNDDDVDVAEMKRAIWHKSHYHSGCFPLALRSTNNMEIVACQMNDWTAYGWCDCWVWSDCELWMMMEEPMQKWKWINPPLAMNFASKTDVILPFLWNSIHFPELKDLSCGNQPRQRQPLFYL